MASPTPLRLATLLALTVLPSLHAQPEGTISTVKSEGIMVTTLAQPEFFIFQSGNKEEHFDGTSDAIAAQGGFEVGEPIAGLHYMRPRLAVDGSPWTDADRRLLDAAFHGGSTAEFYLFKTAEGQLFFLPKEGETKVVRTDYFLRSGQKVTVWARK